MCVCVKREGAIEGERAREISDGEREGEEIEQYLIHSCNCATDNAKYK